MRTPSQFVSQLIDQQLKRLKEALTHSIRPRVRQRAQAILLSYRAFSRDNIASICEVDRDTVSG